MDTALADFMRRGQRSFYRSTLRAAVKKLDKVKPQRSFGDKEEWKTVLTAMQAAGKLTYSAEKDEISMPQP